MDGKSQQLISHESGARGMYTATRLDSNCKSIHAEVTEKMYRPPSVATTVEACNTSYLIVSRYCSGNSETTPEVMWY